MASVFCLVIIIAGKRGTMEAKSLGCSVFISRVQDPSWSWLTARSDQLCTFDRTFVWRRHQLVLSPRWCQLHRKCRVCEIVLFCRLCRVNDVLAWWRREVSSWVWLLMRSRFVLGWVTLCGQPNKVNSAFHPSGVGKLSTSLLGWG